MKNLHLIISAIVLLPVALAYGIMPAKVIPIFFDFNVLSTDLHNIFRAIMCLYIAVGIVLFTGIVKPKYWLTATIINIVLMAGLAAGRILSLIIDGVPSFAFIIGLAGEIILAAFSFYNLKKYALK